MEASKVDAVVPTDIRPLIYEIRGTQVMLDRDLAGLYGVPTKALNQAVKRNAERFPDRFVFRLTDSEMNELVTNCDRFEKLKHSSATMCAFTEQGIAMLSSVLRSAIAVQVSIRTASWRNLTLRPLRSSAANSPRRFAAFATIGSSLPIRRKSTGLAHL